jgi:hypothetical protein
MFSKEFFGAPKNAGYVHEGFGTSKPGSHFKERFFGT